MNNFLVTGGKGFIGSKIMSKIGGISFDAKDGQDILDSEQLQTTQKTLKGIYHCAAKISVPESFDHKDLYHSVNVTGTRNIIDLAEKRGCKIVFSSSAAVYGEKNSPVDESEDLNPLSPYAQNKIDAEELLRRSKVPHISLRYFNVYGPGQSTAYAGVITAFIQNALENKDLVIFGDGNQVRDFIYVDDVADANIAAMNLDNQSFQVFNIASGISTTIIDLARTIISIANSKSKIIFKPARQGDIMYSGAINNKALKTLHWQPKTALATGLEQTVNFHK